MVLALHIDLPYSITIRFTNFNHCITCFDQLKQYFVQISVTFHFHYFSIYLFAGHSIYSVSVFLVCLIVSKFVSFVHILFEFPVSDCGCCEIQKIFITNLFKFRFQF